MSRRSRRDAAVAAANTWQTPAGRNTYAARHARAQCIRYLASMSRSRRNAAIAGTDAWGMLASFYADLARSEHAISLNHGWRLP